MNPVGRASTTIWKKLENAAESITESRVFLDKSPNPSLADLATFLTRTKPSSLAKVFRAGRSQEEMNGEGVEGKETVVNTGGTAVETVVEIEVATVSAPLLTY